METIFLFIILFTLLYLLFKKYYFYFTTIKPILSITKPFQPYTTEYSIKITKNNISPSRKCYIIKSFHLTLPNIIKIMNILHIPNKPKNTIITQFNSISNYLPIELLFSNNKFYLTYTNGKHSIIHSIEYTKTDFSTRIYYHSSNKKNTYIPKQLLKLPITDIFYKFTTNNNITKYTNINIGLQPTPFFKIKHLLQHFTTISLSNFIPKQSPIYWIAIGNDHYTIYYR